jgi:hypothetical protein
LDRDKQGLGIGVFVSVVPLLHDDEAIKGDEQDDDFTSRIGLVPSHQDDEEDLTLSDAEAHTLGRDKSY